MISPLGCPTGQPTGVALKNANPSYSPRISSLFMAGASFVAFTTEIVACEPSTRGPVMKNLLIAAIVNILCIVIIPPVQAGGSDAGSPAIFTCNKQVHPLLSVVAPSEKQVSSLLASISIFDSSIVERSGCCSHHGGVCGCDGGRAACCDGTDSPLAVLHRYAKAKQRGVLGLQLYQTVMNAG